MTVVKVESLGQGITEPLIYPLLSLIRDGSEEVSGFLRGKIRWMPREERAIPYLIYVLKEMKAQLDQAVTGRSSVRLASSSS